MTLNEFLAAHPELEPLEVLEPENCALCWHTSREVTVHVSDDDNGSFDVEEVPDFVDENESQLCAQPFFVDANERLLTRRPQ